MYEPEPSLSAIKRERDPNWRIVQDEYFRGPLSFDRTADARREMRNLARLAWNNWKRRWKLSHIRGAELRRKKLSQKA